MSDIHILIPYYDKNMAEKRDILNRCITSFTGLYSTLTVTKDNDLSQYAKLNKAMKKYPDGDFVIITNDDTYHLTGNLRDLCIEGTVTSPLINNNSKGVNGHCFCLPVDVYYEIGGFDTGYEHGYYDDNDFIFRLDKHGIPRQVVGTVNIGHPDHGGTTLEHIEDRGGVLERNKQRFLEKWGRLP